MPSFERTVMHIDMDAFFASIEQRMNPALRGKPVIIGGRNYKYRSVICAASYEAKALGIANAMPSWKALEICPQAVFVAADTSKYVYTSQRIGEILEGLCPRVEKFSIDEFFLDVSECARFLGGAESMARQIKKRIKDEFGLTCSIGVAPTKVSAKLAAKMKKPDGLCILDAAQARAVMHYLPVEKICGIGERLKERLHLLGVRTCGALAEFPPQLLQEHFGVMGLWLRAACRLEDLGEIRCFAEREGPPKSVGHSQTLHRMSEDAQHIKDWIYLLSEMVAMRLRRKNLTGRTVHFYVSDSIGAGFGKQHSFIDPTCDGREIYRRCLHIIKLLNAEPLRVRVLGVSVSSLGPSSYASLFEEDNRRERLLSCVDKLNNRFGEWTLYPAALKNATYENILERVDEKQ